MKLGGCPSVLLNQKILLLFSILLETDVLFFDISCWDGSVDEWTLSPVTSVTSNPPGPIMILKENYTNIINIRNFFEVFYS